ncbi:MAG: nucleotidyltransferase family protein [Sphingomonas sp.]|uniref:nucleotidyltransferase family protein n=1 Tax=Sphingomonas sp. TaxID=28214 RepID=UPI000DB2A4DC|nr:nucleotidyltransferase family protein [Zymomonas sp.]MBA4773273.1 nucleotidyltransferase family protein [Sphingomonas sp.]PZP20125.1 MAG: nucleotidyltransferase family protein [Sphingomonas hengshuiensis]
MIDPGRVLLALLAAGQSRRFGEADKLSADLCGTPLALHAVAALASIAFLDRVAIVSATAVDFTAHGYRCIINPAPEAGLSGSVRLAAQAARDVGAAALLIVLADMPCITPVLIAGLLGAAGGPADVIAASDGTRPSPPALFGAARFAELMAANGDAGARALLQTGQHIIAPPGTLIDIDTPDDLAAAEAQPSPIRGAARRSD